MLLGNVVIGKNVYVGPGAVLRGDFGKDNYKRRRLMFKKIVLFICSQA